MEHDGATRTHYACIRQVPTLTVGRHTDYPYVYVVFACPQKKKKNGLVSGLNRDCSVPYYFHFIIDGL